MGKGISKSMALAVGVPLVGGFINGILTQDDIKGWYKGLKKPKWTAPDWVFGPVWAVLYIGQGIASHKVWKKKGWKNGRWPLGLYAAQLALNLLWPPLFFRKHDMELASADSLATLGVATAATVAMSKATSYDDILPFMGPYLGWLTYAAALSLDITNKNTKKKTTTATA